MVAFLAQGLVSLKVFNAMKYKKIAWELHGLNPPILPCSGTVPSLLETPYSPVLVL